MANEGSTKPTYSELEAELLRVRWLLQRQSELLKKSLPTLRWAAAMEFDSTRLDDLNHVVEVERFLAANEIPEPDEHGDYKNDADARRARDACLRSMRERGLTYSFSNRGDVPDSSAATDSEHTKELDPVPSGAESADIGKLDRVEEKMDAESIELAEFALNEQAESGSAETGGEKAAPYLLQKVTMPLYVLVAVNEFLGDWRKGDFDLPKLASLDAEAIESAIERWASDPNFPRSSQNQTVSSGVEGAHEGRTADKSEPEKLNNAQKEME